jgi:hypothetical protein
MSHPHQSMLDEFAFAIKHFVPTLPEEVKDEATSILETLSQNPEADEPVIRKAFYEIGVKEYPHRHAYEELTTTSAADQMKKMILAHVDDAVRDVIKPHLDAGVGLNELVRSDVFEADLSAEQRYQVEDGILVAKSKLADSLKEEVSDNAEIYQSLLKKWQEHTEEIQIKLEELEKYAEGGTETQQEEIKNKTGRYREGFIVTENDPDLEEIKKEIEYWQDLFANEEE